MRRTYSNMFLAAVFLSGCFLSSSTIVPRVFNGRPALREEIPYIVSIESNNKQLCAGTILSNDWIITAAHCVANQILLVVYAGLLHTAQRNDGDIQVSYVKEVFIHPDYDNRKDTIDNDVALLMLATNLTFNDVVKPIEIIGKSELDQAVSSRRSGRISGWGDSENYFRSKILRTAEVVLLSDQECLDDIPPQCHAFKPEAHLCSGPLTGPQSGVGLYDDGGPLVVNGKFAGVILHGEHADPHENCHLSSIYARISNYSDFLGSHIDFPDPGKEINSCLLEIEFTLELFNETNSLECSSHLSRTYLLSYKIWLFGSRNYTNSNECDATGAYDETTYPETGPYDETTYPGTTSNRFETTPHIVTLPGDYDTTDFPVTVTEEDVSTEQLIDVDEQVKNETIIIHDRQLEGDDHNPQWKSQKVIFNIKFFRSSQIPEEGSGFRLFPSSPVDFSILFSTRTE